MSAIRFLIVCAAAAAITGTAVGQAMGAEDGDRPERRRGPGHLFERFDSNDDGKITQDEAPQRAWERLSQADSNGDGAVTKEELQAHRPQRGEGERGPRGDGERRRPDPQRLVDHLDKNDDGKISKDEAPERMAEHFDRIDADGDGFVTVDELNAAHQARGERGERRERHNKIDTDGDGKISRDEAPKRMAEHFDEIDSDGDGYLTREELRAAHEARRSKQDRRGGRAE